LDGPSPELAVRPVFVAILVVVRFIDIDHQIIPDVISLPGIAVGFLVSLFPAPQPGSRR
jgi:leader peptidase (prepilin peptidase) / N-methyltransferase